MNTNYATWYPWIVVVIAIGAGIYGLTPTAINFETPLYGETPTYRQVMDVRLRLEASASEMRSMNFNQMEQTLYKGNEGGRLANVYIAKGPTYKSIKKKEIDVTYEDLEKNDTRLEILGVVTNTPGLYATELMGIKYVIEIVNTDYEEVRKWISEDS